MTERTATDQVKAGIKLVANTVKLPEKIENVSTALSSVTAAAGSFFIPKMSAREEKAFTEVLALLDKKKLGGEDTTFNQNDLNAVIKALLKDPQIASQINAGIWNTAYCTAESHVPNGFLAQLFGIDNLVRSIAYHKAENNVRANYGTYYAQGEGVAKQRLKGEIEGQLDKQGVSPKEKKDDNTPRELSLAEIERFRVNLEILNNYFEKAAVNSKIVRSVPVMENGLSADSFKRVKEGDFSTADTARKIPFVPSKSKFLYATDAQLVEFGIPSEQISAYRKANEFYYDQQKGKLIYCTKELQQNKDGSVADYAWGEKGRATYDQYGRYQASSWKTVDDLVKVEADKLDTYARWNGHSTLTLEKVESFGKVNGQLVESFKGINGLEGKRVYQGTNAQGQAFVAIGQEGNDGKVSDKDWKYINPSEVLDLKKFKEHSDWQSVYKKELAKADCQTIAALGLNNKYQALYDFYLKKDADGNNSQLIFVSKTNQSQGVLDIKDLAKQQYPHLNSFQALNPEDASRVAKLRSEEAIVEMPLRRIDLDKEEFSSYKTMLPARYKAGTEFFVGLQGEIISQYEIDGKRYTAVNYGDKEVFEGGKALGDSWVMAKEYEKIIEKLKKQEAEDSG